MTGRAGAAPDTRAVGTPQAEGAAPAASTTQAEGAPPAAVSVWGHQPVEGLAEETRPAPNGPSASASSPAPTVAPVERPDDLAGASDPAGADGLDGADSLDRADESSEGHRIAWATLGAVALLGWAVQLASWMTVFAGVTILVVALAAAGLATIAVGWSRRRSARALAVVGIVGLALVAVAIITLSYLQAYSTPGYLTDELAFDQYAAHLVVHGINPYTHSMAPSFAMFHVTPENYTFRLTGTPVTTLSYPSLAFVVYVPFLLAGWSAQVATAVNAAAWVVSMVVLHVALPRHLRPLAIVLGSTTVYVAYAVGGVTDVLFVPLLLGAAIAWDRYPHLRGWRCVLAPALMGLAMGVKQQPWLVLPFVITGIFLEARTSTGTRSAMRVGARYLGVVALAFVVPNVPFLVADPTAWLRGVATPMLAHTVPAGQGVIGLSLFLGVGGGSLTAYTAAAVAAFGALLVIYVVSYPRLKPLTFVLPAAVLFVSSRSFGSYLVTLVPAGVAAAVTIGPGARRATSRRELTAIGLVAALAGGSVAWALASPAPLALAVESVHTTGQLATVDQLQVRVTNHSRRALNPAFSLETGTTLTSFWLPQGPRRLASGQTAIYHLTAPDFFAMPPITGGFEVVAFTDHPATISRARAYRPTSYHLELAPDAVAQPVPVGRQVTVVAQIVDHFDRAVHQAGVHVYLGQVIYAQQGLQYAEASVNGGDPGQSPTSATTDAKGRATFVIEGTIPTADPVYFEANLVNDTDFYPFGYSTILPIRFVASP